MNAGCLRHRSTNFKSILLDTCQEEFEGTEKAREDIKNITDEEERNEATVKIKLRTLGTIRLIGELFSLKMVSEKVIHTLVQELMGLDAKVCAV